ncbi:MAG: type II CAAX endopeptidase family protein [Nitrobacter sp.]|jgi:CAAX protease family protein
MSSPEILSGPSAPPRLPLAQRPPQVWKFVGTSLWGIAVFAAMFVGQLSVLVYFLIIDRAPFSFDSVRELAGGGLTIALSVVMGLPAALLALWIAIRLSRVPFVDYLALRWTSWWYLLFGIAGMVLLVMGWEGVSYAMGRESSASFMVDVLKSARAEGALWLLVISICVVAPITEEFLTRGFLYRGWSESFLRPVGAIVLSSLMWTAMHLQYDWFFFGEIFSIGLLFGYLRYRSGSIWLTVILHGLNNLAATLQTLWLANQT